MKRSQFTVPFENFDRLHANEYWIEVARGEQEEDYPQEVINQRHIRDDISHALFREDNPGVQSSKSAGIKIVGHTVQQLKVNTDQNNILFEGEATGITSGSPEERDEYVVSFHIEDRGERGLEFYVRYQKESEIR